MSEKMTLTRWLIQKIDTKDYRAGKVTGYKHPKVDQKMIDQIGKENLFRQAKELEQAGLIRVQWIAVGHDMTSMDVPVEAMDELCKRAGVVSPRVRLQTLRQQIEEWKGKADFAFVKDYYQDMLNKLEQGIIPEYADDAQMAKCLIGLPKEGTQEWQRAFSKRVLGDSKLFEKKLRTRFVTILSNYSPRVDEEMDVQEVLAEHGILTYSQTMEWKGPLVYRLYGDEAIDTSYASYGYMINAQTLTHGAAVSVSSVKKIIIIENKANYEEQKYDPEILYIYCHGFFSPKERRFLESIRNVLSTDVEIYHWSDMDYGGIRIYQFIKKNIFTKLKPLYMNRETYLAAVEKGDGIEVSPEKRKKLEAIDAGDLAELKACILEHGLEIEQEALL